MMLKKTLFLLLALFTLMINSHASLQHDIEHHYHHEHDSHESHDSHDSHDSHADHDVKNNLNTVNCEQCLLEHSIAESNHVQDTVKLTLPNVNIFHSALFSKSISSKLFRVYQARAP